MISLIIPSYNRANTIKRSIDCVLAQTESDWELVLVDDGSIDNTKNVINPYLEDRRIKYIYQQNQGVASARNLGAKNAKGDYLVFIDSDDSIEPNLLEVLKRNNFSEYQVIFWKINKIMDGQSQILGPKNLGFLYKYRSVQFLAGSVCYKKTLFLEVGGYDPKMTFGENYELGIRICQKEDLHTLIINEVLGTYFIETSKRTSDSVFNKLPSLIYQYKKHQKLFDGNKHEKSKMYYFFGYLLEKSHKIRWARRFYAASWKGAPWKPKPLLKLVLLTLNK